MIGRRGPVELRLFGGLDRERFGPGSYLEFYGRAVADSLYTETEVYRLEVDPSRARRVRVVGGRPGSGAPERYTAMEAVDRNLAYSFASPTGDPWFEANLLSNGAPATQTFPLVLKALDPGAGGQASLSVKAWGVTDWPGAAPDHHLQVFLNGTFLTEERFDGLQALSLELPLSPALLVDGTNELTLVATGDTGYAFDLVRVDRYALTYPRRFVAEGDRLSFTAEGRAFQVDGFSSSELVAYAETRDGWVHLAAPRISAGSAGIQVAVRGVGEAEYHLSTVAALATPEIAPAAEPAAVLRDRLLAGTADYLVISHPSFLDHLGPLLALQQSRGYSTRVVDVEDLYDAFHGGVVGPEAMAAFLRRAVPELGTRFVLLVGGDTYDYFDRLGLGSVSFIPTPYVATDVLVSFAPSDPLLGDLDGDRVPDLALGRLPVRTPAELATVIAKTLAYEGTPRAALMVADDDLEQGGAFTAASAALEGLVPASWPVSTAYLDDLGVGAARGRIVAGLEAGAALTHFIGHSGPTVWTFDGLFSAGDATALANAAPTLVVQWGCWNTYHVEPRYDTLAHRFLLPGPQGAAAVVGAAALTETASDLAVGPKLMEHLRQPGATLGESLVAAKKEVAATGARLDDVFLGWTLLGDPATVLVPSP